MKNRGYIVLVGVALAGWSAAVLPQVFAGPAQQPCYLVGIAAIAPDSGSQGRFVFRAWSNGLVEANHVSTDTDDPDDPNPVGQLWIGWRPLDDVSPSDINNDGCVDPADLAQVLGQWQPCGQ